ncbi:MAG: transcription antitermination factor NusB [Betaproteobacteria bacterium]|nr:transcription antitermination factor NusB [Betaproteobacteria bacterium]
MRTARRRSREFALQGIYSWLMAKGALPAVQSQFQETKGFDKVDAEFFDRLVAGTIGDAEALDLALAPVLDRRPDELSPVEHAVLLLAAFELREFPDVPYRVVINEAIELAKSYGGTDGHKFVNGVLDKLARRLRTDEARAHA